VPCRRPVTALPADVAEHHFGPLLEEQAVFVAGVFVVCEIASVEALADRIFEPAPIAARSSCGAIRLSSVRARASSWACCSIPTAPAAAVSSPSPRIAPVCSSRSARPCPSQPRAEASSGRGRCGTDQRFQLALALRLRPFAALAGRAESTEA
jgi:hypothetical protein